MNGSKNSLDHIEARGFKVFNKETKPNRHTSSFLLGKAFPAVPYSENKQVNVKGDKSPFDGDIIYWSKGNSKLYDGATSQALKRQDHACGYCGLRLLSDERVIFIMSMETTTIGRKITFSQLTKAATTTST